MPRCCATSLRIRKSSRSMSRSHKKCRDAPCTACMASLMRKDDDKDGLLGISDEQGLLCFALSLWNEADPILKERLFGLTGPEGNHGEDVKEYYYFLDSTLTHSYMKALYKYPQRAFPYAELAAENCRRGRGEPEYELIDTGVFAEDRYFDITVEYAKVDPQDILIRITAANRGSELSPLLPLPR